MAAGENKITAQDIFDDNIRIAYKEFTNLNQEATAHLEKLRAKIVELNKAMGKGKDLDGPMRELNAATKDYARTAGWAATQSDKLEKEVEQLGKKAEKSKKRMSGFSGAVGKLSMGFKSLLGAAGIVGVGYALVNLTKEVYRVSKAIESMDLALSKVTKSSYEFDQAQKFLVEISERLGLNILKTAKRYNTFTAAAQQANLTQKESNEIFETFADVGANLALTSDEMGSIFLALEQMLSKGKVSTEELRRQLGEKLPGAMGLMANALGVTTGKLDDMLRKGEVLSADALPKFAKEVEKTFGVDKTKKVETLAAAQERLTNAWVLLIDKINEDGSGLNTVFKSVFGIMEDLIQATTDWFEKLGFFLKADLSGWERFVLLVKDAFGADAGIDAVIDEERQKQAASNRIKVYQELVNVAKQYHEITKQQGDFDSGMFANLIEDGGLAEDKVEGVMNMIENYKKLIEQTKIKTKEGQSTNAVALGIPTVTKNDLVQQEALIEEYKTVLEEQYADLSAKLLRAQEKLASDLPPAHRKMWEQVVEETERQMRKVAQLQDSIMGTKGVSGAGFEAIDAEEMADYAAGMNRRNDTSFGQEDENKGTIFGGWGDLEAWGERLSAVKDISDAIWEIEEAQHQARLDRIEEEEEAIERKYKMAMIFAEGDAEEQSRLRIRQAEEEEALDQERRRIEREAAIQKKEQGRVDAILNAAIASVKIWASPGFPWALALQGVIAAQLVSSLAAINATHIPQYAKGTDRHPGGLAIVGDGGKKEMIVTPQGKAYLTDDKPQLVSMQSGSKVIADANDYIQKEVIRSIIDQESKMGELMTEKITEAIQRGFYGAKINNSVNVNNKFDYMAYRSQRINGF